ncbi:MAG TPA: FAD-dependent oxidoreductase [Acidimicrobiales bacterium]
MTGSDEGDRGVGDAPLLSRRSVLAGLGAAGAVAAVSGCSSAARTAPRPDGSAGRRVVVVGAGLSGLTCALDLVAAGWDVVVLEARPRVGGRVHTLRVWDQGLHAEGGGESIDDNHHAMQALVARFGLRTEKRPANKILDGATFWRGRRYRTADFVAGAGGAVGSEYSAFYDAIAKATAGVDPAHPDQAAHAAALDRQSLASFIDAQHLRPEARFLVETDYRSEYNSDPAHVSMLFIAQQTNVSAGVPDSAVETMRIHGGNDQLPRAMAASLGSRVLLGAPVTRIEQRADGATVHAGSHTVAGAWVVVACPMQPLRQVTFSPALPASAAALVGGLDLGKAAKVVDEYRERFWAKEHLSGFTVTDLPYGVGWSPTDSYPGTPGLLNAFITGPAAVTASAQGDAARIASVRRQFDEVYPEGRPLRTGRAATVAWLDEPFTGGGYAVFQPGQMAPFWPVLRQGTGRLRFAGEHTETLAGYMESAVRSGHRVAAGIGHPPPP